MKIMLALLVFALAGCTDTPSGPHDCENPQYVCNRVYCTSRTWQPGDPCTTMKRCENKVCQDGVKCTRRVHLGD
jgi:hypothetical protein